MQLRVESGPTLQLWLSGDGVAVDLVTSANHTMQWLSMVLEHHVFPEGIVSRLVRPLEFIRVDT